MTNDEMAARVEEMADRYRTRIANQKAAIERLQKERDELQHEIAKLRDALKVSNTSREFHKAHADFHCKSFASVFCPHMDRKSGTSGS